jgi:DNA-directed RNA polymerase alpha subunit
MQNEYGGLREVYKDAEWVILKKELGTWVRIVDVGGFSLVAKWVQNDAIEGGHIGVLGRPIEDLNMPLRASNALRADGINTIGKLCEQPEYLLKRTPGIGKVCAEHIKKALAEHNLKLRP